jgi:hypothetical protein
MSKQESRFGFGQLAGSLGAVVVAVSVTQPWLRLDLVAAFRATISGSELSQSTANDVLFVGSHVPKDAINASPQVTRLARELGVEATGLQQDKIAAIVLIVLAVIAMIAVIRSALASSAWAARANAPFLALAGFGSLITAAVELWLRAPQPRSAMRPDLGLWMLVGGAVLLLLGALTLGNNRRRPFLDDFGDDPGTSSFDNTEHLAYSHGAWVPRNAADTER